MDIKICGLRTEQTMDVAIACGATHVGLVFHPLSPRHVGPSHGAQLATRAKNQRVDVVAVTVDASDAALDVIVETVEPTMLQLHGKETPERVAELKDRYDLAIIKALAVETADDLDVAETYRGIANRLLFDAKPPKGSDLAGGNGVSFDWSILKKVRDKSFFLSGGLNADNVAKAIKIAKPGGIDVSSGVETAPGLKDPEMIRAFFEAVRSGSRSSKAMA